MTSPGVSASVSVLLVEDDPGDALLTRELLDGSGFAFDVQVARLLSDALVALADGVDCVLLDLELPDARGLEALDEILAGAGKAAVIVLTGRADRDLALAAVARGAQDYLQKGDIDGERLSRSIRYAVERHRSEDAARKLLANELLAAESARLERGLLARPILGSNTRAAARYRSGGGSLLLGGDFYDAIELPDGSVRVLIGDVSGHGPDEAAIGVALRIAWRGFVLSGLEEGAVLLNMQAVLEAERLVDTLFATACDATIAPDRRSVRLRIAGHPAPLLLDDHRPRELGCNVGLPLGIFSTSTWAPAEHPLPEHWALIFYTDGIIEGHTRQGPRARLGTEGLIDAIEGLTWSPEDLGKLADQLLAMAEEQNGGPVADDIALILLACPEG